MYELKKLIMSMEANVMELNVNYDGIQTNRYSDKQLGSESKYLKTATPQSNTISE